MPDDASVVLLQLALLKQLVLDGQLILAEFRGLSLSEPGSKMLAEFEALIAEFERTVAK